MVDALTYRTTDDTRWGPGKEARLTNEEIDINFWSLYIAMVELQMYPPQPVEIVEITVTGDQMTILMSDGSTWGPFPLPTAVMSWTGAWQPNHDYEANQLLTFDDFLYMTTTAFNSGPTFVMGPEYAALMPLPQVFDVGFFFPQQVGFGIPPGEPMCAHVSTRDFHILLNSPKSRASLRIPPAAELVLPIRKNATNIGTVTFAAAATVGTIAVAATSFSPDDVFEVLTPAALDSAAKDLRVTFSCRLGLPA